LWCEGNKFDRLVFLCRADHEAEVRCAEVETGVGLELLTLKPFHFGPFGNILYYWGAYKSDLSEGGAILSALRSSTKAFHCHLAVDKIFGILNMCTEPYRVRIKIDYVRCFRCIGSRLCKGLALNSMRSTTLSISCNWWTSTKIHVSLLRHQNIQSTTGVLMTSCSRTIPTQRRLATPTGQLLVLLHYLQVSRAQPTPKLEVGILLH
jgi:hypothetical protein